MLTWNARYSLHVTLNFDPALCMTTYDLFGEEESCNVCKDARLVSVVVLGELIYHLLSLPSPIDTFLADNEIRDLQIVTVVALEDAQFTQLALIESTREGSGMVKVQSTERARQRRMADLWITSCPDSGCSVSNSRCHRHSDI